MFAKGPVERAGRVRVPYWVTNPWKWRRLRRKLSGKPRRVLLADHELLLMAVAVGVGTAGRAVARRGVRHRADGGIPALVQRTQAGPLGRAM
jgi:hypothetical protein